jgi:hypothetical protein
MTNKTTPPFNSFPSSARKGFMFLLLAWISHFFFLYRMWLFGNRIGHEIVDDKVILQMAAICLLVCFFVLRVRNWARVLGIISNFLAISVYILLCAFFFGKENGLAALSIVNTALFGLCSYFLMKRDSANFFKKHSPRPGGDAAKR